MRRIVVIVALLVLAGCVKPYSGPPVAPFAPPPVAAGPGYATQDQTADTEEHDRIARFQRLADVHGIDPPVIEEMHLPPGSVNFMAGAVPVVRVVFPEKTFFAFDSAVPLPSSGPVLDVIADNMRLDVPDAALTVLGHTDAIGTDAYNIDLSRRRAESVLQALAARGVRADQLSEVAIGKRQPIAPNDTAEGRALNRRVEFLVSPALSANLAAVQQRVVPVSYFAIDKVQPRTPLADVGRTLPNVASVYRLAPAPVSGRAPDADGATLSAIGDVALSPVAGDQVDAAPVAPAAPKRQPVAAVALAPVKPAAPVQLIQPAPVAARPLGESTPY